jgi:hypothetical protein
MLRGFDAGQHLCFLYIYTSHFFCPLPNPRNGLYLGEETKRVVLEHHALDALLEHLTLIGYMAQRQFAT